MIRSRRRRAQTTLHLVLTLFAAPLSAAEPEAWRVVLDRLTWAPDGSALAVEARTISRRSVETDTLLIDLSRGGLTVRNPKPLLAAFDESGVRLAAATRFGLYYGPRDSPGDQRLLAVLDPGRGSVNRLAFSRGGDSLMVLRRSSTFEDIVAYDIETGRETLRHRLTDPAASRELWSRETAGEMSAVEPVPFGALYLPVRRGLFFLERSTTEVRGLEGHWLYDLHFRNDRDTTEVLLARSFVPFLSLVSPDSAWLAVAGDVARPDYGGGLSPELLMIATDGSRIYTVLPEGAPSTSTLEIRTMGWAGKMFCYVTAGGLFRVDPEVGRSRAAFLGSPAPAWSDSLAPEISVTSLVLPELLPDTTAAARVCDRLRRDGLPAWILPAARIEPNSAGYRVAVAAAGESDELESWALELERLGIHDFNVRNVPAADAGIPFPYGGSRGPDRREAFLVDVGPPWSSELWITEMNGARRVRLIRAMATPALH